MEEVSAEATRSHVMDAALAALIAFGSRHASVAAIARRAGVSHMTIYRLWPKKDQLISSTLDREARAVFDRVDATVANIDDVTHCLLEGFTEIFWAFYAHPLLMAEFDRNPDVVLRSLTISAEPTFELSVTYLAGHVERRTELEPDEARTLADAMVRVTHSLLLTSLSTRPFAERTDVQDWANRELRMILRVLEGSEPGPIPKSETRTL
ncbi:TetR/AcrR family transcriptional regulator [Gordonia sp. PDNC005]|nr:TetR/AcrR family transcriptional regulator [Gordonia sp. PDNC005]